MSGRKIKLDLRWPANPMSADEVAARMLAMLSSLERIDERFAGMLTGGSSPNPKKGWRPLPTSAADMETLLLRESQSEEAGPLMPRYLSVGIWNGRVEDASAVGMSISALTTGPEDKFGTSFAQMNFGADGLDDRQVEGAVRALVDAWDPATGIRTDIVAGNRTRTSYQRGTGWTAE